MKFFVLVAGFSSAAAPAGAISAGDLMTGMNEDRRNGYITGLIDMLSYQAVLDRDMTRARCINDQFYRNKENVERVVKALYEFPDRAPVAIVIVVMNKACGG